MKDKAAKLKPRELWSKAVRQVFDKLDGDKKKPKVDFVGIQ